jgi:very-short-patch-repair endonuclease
VLAAGPGAVVTGPLACRLRGLPLEPFDQGARNGRTEWRSDARGVMGCDLMLILPADRHVVAPGARIVRTDVPIAHVSQVSGLPVATVTRALVDALRYLPRPAAVGLLDRAVQRRWMTADTLVAWAEYLSGKKGAPQLRGLAQRARLGAHSEAERLAVRLVRRADIAGLVVDHHVLVDGHLVARLDLAFPASRVAVEIDGMAYHSDAQRFQYDRTRQNLLVSLGWTVLRFTWRDLEDRPGYVVATIRGAL